MHYTIYELTPQFLILTQSHPVPGSLRHFCGTSKRLHCAIAARLALVRPQLYLLGLLRRHSDHRRCVLRDGVSVISIAWQIAIVPL